MSLYGYKPKHRKAPWTTAFPVKVVPDKVMPAGVLGIAVAVRKDGRLSAVAIRYKRIRPISKRRQQRSAEYTRKARAFVAAAIARGWTCPVVACIPELRYGVKYGWPISNRLNEVHHTRGRAGALLLDERYWLAVSKQGHRWIHEHPAQARNMGWLAQPGEWNTPVAPEKPLL